MSLTPAPEARQTDLRSRLRQSVAEVRMQAALNLGARGVPAAGRIMAACELIVDAYGQNKLPAAEQITAIRDGMRELQTLLASYGASGIEPAPVSGTYEA